MNDVRPLFARGSRMSPPAVAPRFLGRASVDVDARPVPAFATRLAPAAALEMPAVDDVPEPVEVLDVPNEPPPPPVCGQTCQEHAATLEEGVDSLYRRSEALAEHARHDAVAIGLELAMRILGRELRDNVEPLLGFVDTALARIADSRTITVRVSLRDFEAMVPRVASLPNKPVMARVDVIQDASLGCGECRVDSELGSIDGRLSTRVGALLRVLEAELGAAGADDGAGTS